ncbi:hypothetical protein OFS96_26160, partial [Escherichia coli]|nr:hypothetical protein [Escherichia coli]
MVNNHRHSYGESIKNPPRALLLNSIQTTNYALNVRFRSIGPQTPTLQIILPGLYIGTVAKLAMRQPFVLFKGLTFQKLCLPGAFRPGDHHN